MASSAGPDEPGCRSRPRFRTYKPAVPNNHIARGGRPHPQGDPRIRPTGQPERPEGHSGREIRPDPLVGPDRVGHQLLLGGAHPVDMPGEMDAAEQRIAKRKGDLVIAPFGLRVRPGSGLLGRERHRGCCRDRWVAQVILLVAGRMQLEM